MYDMYTPPMVQVRHKPVVYDLGSSEGDLLLNASTILKRNSGKETSQRVFSIIS